MVAAEPFGLYGSAHKAFWLRSVPCGARHDPHPLSRACYVRYRTEHGAGFSTLL